MYNDLGPSSVWSKKNLFYFWTSANVEVHVCC